MRQCVLFYSISGRSPSPPSRESYLPFRAKFDPFQFVAVHQGTTVIAACHFRTFGNKFNVDGFYLFGEVEILDIFYAYRVKGVAEIAQSFDMNALALCHTSVHHTGDIAKYGPERPSC